MKAVAVLIAVLAVAAADVVFEMSSMELRVKGVEGVLSEAVKQAVLGMQSLGIGNSAAGCATPAAPVPQNKTFYVFPTKVNWHQAMMICNSHNLRLASLESESDQAVMVNDLKSTGLAKTGVHFWVSASNLAATERYEWYGTGKPMIYTNWMKSEPNNNGGNEHCVEVRGVENDFKWNGLPCSEKIYVICEDPPRMC